MAEALADLGEWELIRRLGAFAPPGQFADDAAVLEADDRKPETRSSAALDRDRVETGSHARLISSGALVVNTDVLVEGLHFSDATTGPEDVGWRAAAANLSDLAAMGCTEVVGLTVGLVAPGSTPWSWVEGVYRGLSAALGRYGGLLLGGDCSGGEQRVLAVSALGRLSREGGPIRRRDGRPGDWLVTSGPHGLSRLGLALLRGELTGPGLPKPETAGQIRDPIHSAGLTDAAVQQAIRAHQRPLPRFDAVRAVIASRPADSVWRVGGCDSSDGLAAAVRAIAGTSGCSARLERQQLPLDPVMATLPSAEAWCLGGGEDFELVLALEPPWAQALVQALPGATVIGRLTEGQAGDLGWSDASPWPQASEGSGGFQHFG
ncbi:MAG: thiamine-phosphate kinase [Cyanobium sp.]